MYVGDLRTDCNPEVASLIRSGVFWMKLSALEVIIETIYEMQKISESDHSSVGRVYPRWISLNAHLTHISQDIDNHWSYDLDNYLYRVKAGWNKRLQKQLYLVYVLAYVLQP